MLRKKQNQLKKKEPEVDRDFNIFLIHDEIQNRLEQKRRYQKRVVYH